ncbi:hypothetical protein GCM10009530_38360 [Microbispora corallina]|uniref:Uncharacterized protein n=1 Tax=Microbispora corallina TaxID=83302 RepID=A0ABQ4G2J8_9ACTN|nr:hypothetical protein Mco01_42840 [Microbispora corallina]
MTSPSIRPSSPGRPGRTASGLQEDGKRPGVSWTQKEVPKGEIEMTRTHRHCPRCRTELDEGPILYRCARCERAVYAADLDLDYVPAGSAVH